jgi:predicted nucleic acid-binding protein
MNFPTMSLVRHFQKCPSSTSRQTSKKSALEVHLRLAELGHHRAPSIPDLLIAATAELAKLTVFHHDKDFELIA